MSKIKLPKVQDKNIHNHQEDVLDSLVSNQQFLSKNTHKSLVSLKKIKQQLKEIVAQRKKEQYRFNTLKKETHIISQQIKKTETNLSKKAKRSKQFINNDLQQIKISIEETTQQFGDTAVKLEKEITSLKDLVKRVDNKIVNIEKEVNAKDLKASNHSHVLLLKKISHFEEILNQFKDTGIDPEESFQNFTTQLNQLDKVMAHAKNNHDDQITLLQTNITNIRQLLQCNNDTAITETKKQKKEFFYLKEKINSMADAIEDSQHTSALWKKDFSTHIMTQSNTALVSTQQIIEQLNKQKKSVKQQFKDQSKHYDKQVQPLHNKISDLQNNQKQSMSPLKEHLSDFKETIQTLQDGYKKQQKIIDEDTKNLQSLNETINQFNEQLEESYQELKEHIQHVRDSDNDENSQQFQELNKNFERLSQQFLDQQQQLENYESQIVKLNPLLGHHDETQAFDDIDNIHSHQNNLSEQEAVLQSNLTTLKEQSNNDYSDQQKELKNLASEQEIQDVHFEPLNDKLTMRGQLFIAGLLTTIAISTVLFYYRDMIYVPIDTDSTTEIKTNDIKPHNVMGEENTRIDDLIKQNTSMAQKFSTFEASLTQVKKQVEDKHSSDISSQTQTLELLPQNKWSEDVKLLENNWKQQHEALQGSLHQTQAEQELLKQSIADFSNSIDSMLVQINQLKKIPDQEISPILDKKEYSIPSQQQKSDISINIKNIKHPFYTIQILAAKDEESIIRFTEKNQLPDNIQIINTHYNDKAWYILAYGQFISYSEAKNKLHTLSQKLQNKKPWIRKLP